MPVLGITGGIASGKSTFAEFLSGLIGSEVFNADHAARRLLEEDSEVVRRVIGRFSEDVTDGRGQISRERLRARAFRSEEDRKALEEILHPLIRAEWLALAARFRNDPQNWYLVDIPLLFETRAESQFDRTVVVAASEATQIQRLMLVRKLPEEMANQMIRAQLPMEEKIGRADHVVWNGGGKEELERQARLLATRLQAS